MGIIRKYEFPIISLPSEIEELPLAVNLFMNLMIFFKIN